MTLFLSGSKLLSDFNSWDLVDGCCGELFVNTPFAFEKAIEWSSRINEYEKRASFSMMAMLAVHDKKADDKKFELFFPVIIKASDDNRNFVRKAVNWALRQIGKRNLKLCNKAIMLGKVIYEKGDSSSQWISSDALKELEKYKSQGRIKSIGNAR